MKNKYICLQTRKACLTRQRITAGDIFAELENTIAERNRNMQRLENILKRMRPEFSHKMENAAY